MAVPEMHLCAQAWTMLIAWLNSMRHQGHDGWVPWYLDESVAHKRHMYEEIEIQQMRRLAKYLASTWQFQFLELLTSSK